MKSISVTILSFVTLLMVYSCKNSESNSDQEETATEMESETTMEAEVSSTIIGNYVTESYKQRSEGYDWVAVSVTERDEGELYLKIRSRVDTKKPSCTMDMKAYKQGENSYQAISKGKPITISFEPNSLRISIADPADEWVVAYPCSGGATIAGVYEKIDGALDPNQLDPTSFSKSMDFGDKENYWVTAVPKDGKTQLTIEPVGPISNQEAWVTNFDGTIMDAEIGDLNGDGHAEILVYTKNGPNEAGHVIAISSNAGKSISQAYFVPAADNPNIRQGYSGQDNFTIIENKLSQKFPLYENGSPTGKSRQVVYKLVDGEAMRQFEVESVNDY